MVTALEDTRTINSITMQGTNERDGDHYAAKFGIEIRAYGEPGMYCNLLWFVILEDDKIIARLNGAAVESVTYVSTRTDKVEK